LAQYGGECAPNGRLVFAVNTHERSARVDVSGTSVVFVTGNQAHHWVALDGIAFTKEAGQSLDLQNGWVNYGQNYRGASFIKIGAVCSLSGLIKSASWASVIAVLPQECRPRHRLIFAANVHTSSARIDIQTNGEILYVSGKQQWDWISLDNIKFVIPGPKPLAHHPAAPHHAVAHHAAAHHPAAHHPAVHHPAVHHPAAPVHHPAAPVVHPAAPAAPAVHPAAPAAQPAAPVAQAPAAASGLAGLNGQIAGQLGALANKGAQYGIQHGGAALLHNPFVASHLNAQQLGQAQGLVNQGATAAGNAAQQQVVQAAPGLLNKAENFGKGLFRL